MLNDIISPQLATESTSSSIANKETILLVTLLTKPQTTLLPDWDSHSNSVYGMHIAWLTN